MGSISSRQTRRILRQASCRFCSAKCRKSRKRRWDGGADGLIFYRAICDIWAKKLHPNGVLAVEIGENAGAGGKGAV